jgi:ribosome-binding protein aMBF1 (putative translation factor)
MKSYTKIKKQLLKDGAVKKEYQKLSVEFMLAQMIIEKRLSKGLTQATLAHKIGTKQSAIARLESGSYNPSLIFMEKIAKALDLKLHISLS